MKSTEQESGIGQPKAGARWSDLRCLRRAVLLGFSAVCLLIHGAAKGDERPYEKERRELVEQLSRQGIRDARVLGALQAVPRHLFVPERIRALAYVNHALPLAEGQTISQPYVVALMTELLQLKGDEKVLEIGTGSGYQAAVLSHLAKHVYTIEIIPELARTAAERLEGLGYENITVKLGDGFYGWEEKAPFDSIMLTAAAPSIPERLWQQLAEGGTLVLPLGPQGQTQQLVRVIKRGGKPHMERITGVLFVPMTGTIQANPP